MMCLQILRYQDTNLWNNAEKLFFQPILDHITMYISVSELLELGSFLMLSVLGSVHNDDIVAINSFFLKWSVNESKLHWCIGAYDDSEAIFFLDGQVSKVLWLVVEWQSRTCSHCCLLGLLRPIHAAKTFEISGKGVNIDLSLLENVISKFFPVSASVFHQANAHEPSFEFWKVTLITQ